MREEGKGYRGQSINFTWAFLRMFTSHLLATPSLSA